MHVDGVRHTSVLNWPCEQRWLVRGKKGKSRKSRKSRKDESLNLSISDGRLTDGNDLRYHII